MKRGKDEEKMLGPMFPRLHVNDTIKGGPRAPPRNKMALYEQLSIPSQRYSHLALPRNPSSSSSTISSSQGVAREWDVFLPYHLPSKHQSEKQFGQYYDRSTSLTQVEQRKKLDEDDFRVPIFVHSVSNRGCGTHGTDPDREKIASELECVNGPLKFKKFQKIGILERGTIQEGKLQKKAHSKNSATGTIKAISNPSSITKSERLKNQTDSHAYQKPGDDQSHNNSIDGIEPSLCVEALGAVERRSE